MSPALSLAHRCPASTSTSDLVRQEFRAWLAATQLVRKTGYAATVTSGLVGVEADDDRDVAPGW
jgi:hypothetical protein